MGIFTKKKDSLFTTGNANQGQIVIKQITINSTRDFTVLRHNLIEGNVMVCNLKPLIKIAQDQKNNSELHSYLQQIKHYCLKNGGSVAKLKESLLLVTPNESFMINSKKTN